MGVHTLCFLCMRLEACNCIPSHPLFTPLQFRIVCHRIQLRERLFRLLLIAESSPSSHTACLSSQTMRLPSQAHGLGLQIIASHCNKHPSHCISLLPIARGLPPIASLHTSIACLLPHIASHRTADSPIAQPNSSFHLIAQLTPPIARPNSSSHLTPQPTPSIARPNSSSHFEHLGL